MAISSTLFNTGTAQIAVSFNRGIPPVTVNGIAPPRFTPQPGFPAPGWDIGGPSPGNLGPGPNTISLLTGGVILPPLTVTIPDDTNPNSVQTYLIWSYDKKTGAAKLGVVILSAGDVIAWGVAPPPAQRS